MTLRCASISLPNMRASRIHTIIVSDGKYKDHDGVRLKMTAIDLVIKLQNFGNLAAGPAAPVGLMKRGFRKSPLWLAQRTSIISVKQRTRDFDTLHASGTVGAYLVNASRKSKMPSI